MCTVAEDIGWSDRGMARTRVRVEQLRFELARRGWDGCDLATAAGLSCATVLAAVRGRSVSTATLRKIVVALSGAPVLPGIDELVGEPKLPSRWLARPPP